MLYRRSNQLFVLLHLFEKASDRVPGDEIAVAESHWEDFRARMDGWPRRPPRAAGQDAP